MFRHNTGWNRHRDSGVGRHHPVAGFTLVELLVVIAIIGILVGLLLPAVGAAREAGRRAACSNNLRQIALAATQYETSLRQYPLNWGKVGTVGQATQGTGTGTIGASWLTALLPNLDQKPLFDQVMYGQNLGYSDNSGYNNGTVLTTVVNTFLCPSDTQRGTVVNNQLGIANAATTNYKACAGSNWVGNSADGVPTTASARGRSSNTASASDGLDHGNGVICRGGGTGAGGAPITTANMDIRDGASKTFLAGEAVPEWCGWSLWFWFDGSTATCGIPLNYRIPGKAPQTNFAVWKDNYSFMSRHPSGANFAACDGSVHYINDQIDFAIYQALATIDGNESADWPN